MGAVFFTLFFLAGLTIAQDPQIEVVRLSPDQQSALVDRHNALRAQIDATNMAKLLWDPGLSDFAADWASNCNADHRPLDERKNAAGYSYVGENIAWGELSTVPDMTLVANAWWNERSSYTFGSFPDTCAEGKTCGHFTQMAWAETCAVGCAGAVCPSITNGLDVQSGFVVVCYYGPGGNVVGNEPWEQGAKCDTCLDSCVDNLCDIAVCGDDAATTQATGGPSPPGQSETTYFGPPTATTPENPPTLPPPSTTTEEPPPIYVSPDCVNDYPLCPYWAQLGDCYRNKYWMHHHCKGACHQFMNESSCPITGVVPTEAYLAPPCENIDRTKGDCQRWAGEGRCETNRFYMQWKCRRACGLCGEVIVDTPTTEGAVTGTDGAGTDITGEGPDGTDTTAVSTVATETEAP